jgi:hypothetical protein
MLTKKVPDGRTYTSAQVREKLDISSSTLKNLVERGLIEKVTMPGYKQGHYTKESVDQYFEQKQLFTKKYLEEEQTATTRDSEEPTTTMTEVRTREEMEQCMEISQALFGVGMDVVDERMKILEKNASTYFMLKKDNEAIGYFSLMPLKFGKLDDLLKQTLPVRTNVEDIEEFKSGVQIDLYLTAIGVKPGFSTPDKLKYGSRLLGRLIDLILDLGKQGIEINTIAARSNMPDGIRLMKHAGFTEIEPATPERRTFIIYVKESGIPFMQQYKRALADWRQNHTAG